ncbi:MAG TPA: hypothetical protein VEU51_14605 [Candidatus Acidoferrales bacterium]|nr:hypothetical protein [Candidatus Acidoferrales bacterium]
MAVHLRDPQRILANHQVPAHRGVARVVRVAIARLHLAQRAAPAHPRILKVADRLAGLLEEEIVVLNLAGQLKASTEREMALEHLQRPRAELNQPIRRGLGPVLVARHDTRLADADLGLGDIAVTDEQRDLLGRPQAREEPKLIVVALRFAPVSMDGGDQGLGLLDAERIDDRPILLGDAQAFEAGCRIVLLGRIAIAVVEGAAKSADDVVVGFLRARVRIRDLHEFRIAHFREQSRPKSGTPDVGENLAVAVGGRESEVMLGNAGIDML